MSFFGYWLPSQPQINEPAMLNRPTRPMAQPPNSRAETRVPKNDMPTTLSEMYDGRWSPMNVTWKPHTKKPIVSSQKPCVRNASCSAPLVPCGIAAPGFGAAARCSRNPKASGTITIDITPTMNMVVCQLSSRDCSSDTNGTMANWPNDPPAVVTPSASERFSGGVCRLMEPKIGPNPAAAMPMPHATFPRVSMTPSVANAIMNMPMTYRTLPAATVRAVPKRSAKLPTNGENAPISSIASALANDHSSRPTCRSAAIGFWKIPKLWRAPIPMVRITAPQITAIQKLRCRGSAAASDEGTDMGRL